MSKKLEFVVRGINQGDYTTEVITDWNTGLSNTGVYQERIVIGFVSGDVSDEDIKRIANAIQDAAETSGLIDVIISLKSIKESK